MLSLQLDWKSQKVKTKSDFFTFSIMSSAVLSARTGLINICLIIEPCYLELCPNIDFYGTGQVT